MGTPHKHRDVIIAWANGEEVEYLNLGGWVLAKTPSFHESLDWRIKPKRVKKEGWIGVHKTWTKHVYETEKECRADCHSSAAIIRIEWEEEA